MGFCSGSRIPCTPGATGSQSISASVAASITTTALESVGVKNASRSMRCTVTNTRPPTIAMRFISGMPSASANAASEIAPTNAPVDGFTIHRSGES